jgi:hypothetical protein
LSQSNLVACGVAGSTATSGAPAHKLLLCNLLLPVGPQEQEEEGDSRRNEGEARVAIAHVKRLVAAGVPPASIGLITPYSAQAGAPRSIDQIRKESCASNKKGNAVIR